MTVHELLAEGRLAEAIAIQEAAVAAGDDDLPALRLLIDLYAFDSRLDEAAGLIDRVQCEEPSWSEEARRLSCLFRAERQRSCAARAPRIVPEPAPVHTVQRVRTLLLRGDPEGAITCIDAADAAAPHLQGFFDGQEFEGLHDSDECFGSVLEAFAEGEYLWFAWETLRKVTLAPAVVLLDQLYRSATVTLNNGSEIAVHLPLVYPNSHREEAVFALGMETDHICPDGGPTRCIGAKLLIVGDGAEVSLADCRMIEIRSFT